MISPILILRRKSQGHPPNLQSNEEWALAPNVDPVRLNTKVGATSASHVATASVNSNRMKGLTVRAPAKLNFHLDVLGKREDNYHQIQSVVQTITLCDTLHFEQKQSPGIRVICEHPDVPPDENNLVYQAAHAFVQLVGLHIGIEITLKKHIPVTAGLGGGSADAAATLLALNHLFQTGIPFSTLLHYGSKLGADVPFCLIRGTALVKGKGDLVYPLPPLKQGWFVLVFPRIAVSSSWAYQHLRYHQYQQGSPYRLRLSQLRNAIQARQVQAIGELMYNRLEEVVTTRFPLIQAVKQEFMRNGARRVLMSGSGSTVFAVLDRHEQARILAERMRSSGQVYVARPTVDGVSRVG